MIRRLNRLRKQGVTIEDRDWVMLETEGLNAGGHALLSAKNRPRYLGPFKVIDSDQVLENYHLELPPSLRRVYPWFSSQKLKVFHKADEAPMTQAKVLDRSLIGGVRGTGAVQAQGPGPVGGTEDEYTFKRILDDSVRPGKNAVRMFLVEWEDYAIEAASWEPERQRMPLKGISRRKLKRRPVLQGLGNAQGGVLQ